MGLRRGLESQLRRVNLAFKSAAAAPFRPDFAGFGWFWHGFVTGALRPTPALSLPPGAPKVLGTPRGGRAAAEERSASAQRPSLAFTSYMWLFVAMTWLIRCA